jgi:hypothetical protein
VAIVPPVEVAPRLEQPAAVGPAPPVSTDKAQRA